MKIASVKCWVLRVPFEYPLRGTHHALITFVEIETDNGLKGNALSTTPMRWGLREYINREVSAEIVGMDPMRPETIRMKLLSNTTLKYFMGAFNCAASLIDVALWDIKGKATGQPIWKLLGGAHATLPTYITFGRSWYSVDELVEIATSLVKDGHKALKMVVGAAGPGADDIMQAPSDWDIKGDPPRVQAVREAIGPDIELMVDANKSLTPAQAHWMMRALEPYNLTWFEDPILNGDPRLLADLRRKTNIPLAAGSTGTSDIQFLREFFLLESVDFIQPNIRDIGGYTQGIKAAGMAQAFNIPMSMGGNYPHLNMHLHGGVPNGGRIEFHLQGYQCTENLFDGVPFTKDGWLVLPEAPGLGFTPKDGILDYAVD